MRGSAAGITIFRTVAHGPRHSMRATSRSRGWISRMAERVRIAELKKHEKPTIANSIP